jgi:shikimate dehydrogenase
MPLYGLIGFPLQHSFSRDYFLEKFRRENIPGCDYQLFPLQHISEFPDLLKKHPELAGINVTIPYKETVLEYVHQREAVVDACGAANCLKIINGVIWAYNTDTIGFEQSLAPLLKKHHKKALVLGTGGASKAVAWVLKKKGIEFLYVSRNPEQHRENTIGYLELTDDLLHEHLLIINTTPVGMYPNVNGFPDINYHALSTHHLLYDMVYNPEKTIFLQKAEAQGAAIKNGYEMLLLQAEASWSIWNKKPVE